MDKNNHQNELHLLHTGLRDLHVSKPTVWAWEQGKARPTPERIAALAERLGVSEDQLCTGRDDDALAEALGRARHLVAKAYGVDPARVKVWIEV